MPAPVIKAQRVGCDACYLIVPQQLTRYNVATLFGLQQSTAVLRDLDGNDTSVSADARNLIPPMAPNGGGGGGNGGDPYLWSLTALAEKAAVLHADPGAAFVVHAMGTDAPLPASAQQNAAQKKVLLKQRGDARVRLVKKLAAEKAELDKAWSDAPWTIDSAMPVPQDSHLLGTAATSPPPPPPAAAAPVAASAVPAATAVSASTPARRSQANPTPAGGTETVMEDGVAKRRCPRCQDLVVEQNFTLHSLRCRGPAQQQQQQPTSSAPPPASPAAAAPTAPLAQPQRTVPSSSAQPQQPQPVRDQPGAPPPRAAVPSPAAPLARGLSSSSSSSALPPALTSEICPQCKTTVPPALWSAHPTICPKRACHCTYCGDTVPYGEYPDHVAQCKAEKTEQCPICGQTVGRNAMRAHREVCGASHQPPHQGRTHVPAAEPASAATAGTRTASWPSSSSSAAPAQPSAQRPTAALGAAAYTPSASPTSPPGGLGAVQGTSVLPTPPVQEDPDRLVRCGDCGTMIPHSSKVGHSVVCAGAPMQCQWCSETLPRSLMEAHERRCGGQTSACPICSARVARQDLKRHPCYAILHPEDEEAQRYALESQREVESRSQQQQLPRSQPRGSPSLVPTHSSQAQPAAVPATSALMDDDDEDDIVARAPIGTVASAMTDSLLGPAAQERSRLAQEEAQRLHGPSATGRSGVAGNGARGAGGVSSYLPHNRRAGGAAHGRLNTGVASRTSVGAGAGGAGTAGTTPSIPSYAAGTASSTTHRRGAGTGPSGTVARGRPSYGASPTNPPATGGTSSARGAQGTIQRDLASVGLGGVTAAARRATSNVGSSVASGVRGVAGSSGTGPSRAAGGSSTIGAGAGTTRRSTSSTAARGRGSTSTMGPAPARTTTTTTPAGPAGTRAGAHGAGASERSGAGSYGSAELARLGVAGRGTRQPTGPSASAHRYDVRPSAHSGPANPPHGSGHDHRHSPSEEDDEAVARRLQEQQDEEYARLMASGDPTFGGESNAYGGAPSSSHHGSGLGAGGYRGSGSDGGGGGYDYGGVPSHPQPQRLAGSIPRQDDDEDAALAAQLARDDEARLQDDDVGYAQVLQHQGRQEAEESDWALAQRLHAEEQSRGRRDFLSDDFRGGPGQRGGPGGPGGVPGIDPPARSHQPPRDPSGFGGGGAPDRATQEELDAAFARQLAQEEGGY